MITLNSEFWNKRYLDKETGWDIGYVSTPIKEYFNQVKNKELKKLTKLLSKNYTLLK